MRQRADFEAWLQAYLAAWDSNDRHEIAALFTEDAEYYTAPFRQPWRGRNKIVEGWLQRRDEPGDHSFRYEVIALDGDLGVVRGWTRYKDAEATRFSNLWLIRLGSDGMASSFTEWWMQEG